jgi:hypothetical protein
MFDRKTYQRKWRQEHPKQKREYDRKYRERHIGLYQKHKEKIKFERQNMRRKVFEHLGNKCVSCGESDFRCLQIDHVHGHGVKEIRKLCGNSKAYYDKILNDTNGNYQLLCANCNWKKRYDNKEYSKYP